MAEVEIIEEIEVPIQFIARRYALSTELARQVKEMEEKGKENEHENEVINSMKERVVNDVYEQIKNYTVNKVPKQIMIDSLDYMILFEEMHGSKHYWRKHIISSMKYLKLKITDLNHSRPLNVDKEKFSYLLKEFAQD